MHTRMSSAGDQTEGFMDAGKVICHWATLKSIAQLFLDNVPIKVAQPWGPCLLHYLTLVWCGCLMFTHPIADKLLKGTNQLYYTVVPSTWQTAWKQQK